MPALYQRRLTLTVRTPRELLVPLVTPVLFAVIIAPALASICAEPRSSPAATWSGSSPGRCDHRAAALAHLRHQGPPAHPRAGPAALRPHQRRHGSPVQHLRFLAIFSTKGAEKRGQHGSKGATVFRDPTEDDRVWVLFDWDLEGWKSFVSDPEVPAILQEAGHMGRPQVAELGGTYDA